MNKDKNHSETCADEPILYGPDLIGKHGFWTILKEDYAANNRRWAEPGFRAVAVHRFGTWRKVIKFAPLRKVMGLLYYLMNHRVRTVYGIELHDTAKVGRRLVIAHQGGIVIHRYATIGDDCMIRQCVTIGAGVTYDMKEAPVLGSRVTLGAGSVVIGPVQLGDDTKVGPNAVVQTHIKPGSTVFAPASRVITMPKPKPAPTPAQDDT
ncbi:MAG: serine acetyltransferase [Alphaproteobacteria bacterium]|mgnify:CR=1 FL=1|jgi:serine O-acetyltransferase|nr:serine acetyltransferase [Alphaproteobacteria bacterium]